MKLFQVLPRRMDFSADDASSVELCVADWVKSSRFRHQTTIVAEQPSGAPLLPLEVLRLTPATRLSSWRAAWDIRRAARARGCELIVSQQHIATAARYADFNPTIPVVLQTHNYVAPRRRGTASWVWNLRMRRRLGRLGGITFVSQATQRDFAENWPEIRVPRTVINNGFDFSQWTPSSTREKQIIAVGRTQPDKGLLEAAQGCTAFLARHPDWSAVFVLSEADKQPGYRDRVAGALAPAGARARLLSQVPFSVVKALNESAAIAIVASLWREPFGRTALEAHAGGAALISSGTGGLREISAEAAAYLDEISGPAIAAMLERVAADAEWRDHLAQAAAVRVRRLFSLVDTLDATGAVLPSVGGKLDSFYETVVASWQRR